MNEIAVGQIWKRKAPFKERLEVRRVWGGKEGDFAPETFIRAHPVHGGRPIVCSPEWLEEECTFELEAAVHA
jgi:hypothetical protein